MARVNKTPSRRVTSNLPLGEDTPIIRKRRRTPAKKPAVVADSTVKAESEVVAPVIPAPIPTREIVSAQPVPSRLRDDYESSFSAGIFEDEAPAPSFRESPPPRNNQQSEPIRTIDRSTDVFDAPDEIEHAIVEVSDSDDESNEPPVRRETSPRNESPRRSDINERMPQRTPPRRDDVTPVDRAGPSVGDKKEPVVRDKTRGRRKSLRQRREEEAEVIATLSGKQSASLPQTKTKEEAKIPVEPPAKEFDAPRGEQSVELDDFEPLSDGDFGEITAPSFADELSDDSAEARSTSAQESSSVTDIEERSTPQEGIQRNRGASFPARRPATGAPRYSRIEEDTDEQDIEPESSAPVGEWEMLINAADPDECRIAILREGRLDELQIESASSISNVGNIYKGRVANVEPSIQAAFVDFGLPAKGFLHISDLHPQYFPDSKGEVETVGKKTPRRNRPPIQQCLKRGQEVIVQVIKEGIGTKGPTLSSYLSLPGRFLVMMPGMEQLGVSRKIEDDDVRRKMRDILGQLSLPKDMGFILRTAGVNRTKRDLQRDLNFLSRLWKRVELRIKKEPAPAALYKESDLVIRTIRDVYDASVKRIVVDNPIVANRVKEFLAIASPRAQDVVEIYTDPEPLFHRFGIEAEIDQLHSKRVPLPCKGSLIIEQTEAMVAIDVNSGGFRVHDNAEETAFRVNMEAADEIARQLRLRDLGGLIICDFIDMLQERHRRKIENRLAEALRKHKERAKILRISKFGLLEMTRQRQRPSLSKSVFRDCPRCAGSGRIKAPEAVGMDLMRRIRMASHREGVASIDLRVATAVANDLLNRKRQQLADLEKKNNQKIRITGEEAFFMDQFVMTCTDRRGREVMFAPTTHPQPVVGRDRGSRDMARPPQNLPPRPRPIEANPLPLPPPRANVDRNRQIEPLPVVHDDSPVEARLDDHDVTDAEPVNGDQPRGRRRRRRGGRGRGRNRSAPRPA